MSPETIDADLLARLSRGDDTALRELYGRCAALVFTVAARLLPAAQAEEVVQEVFFTLWRKHAAFDPERGSLRTWLTHITKNRALNEARRSRLRAEVTDDGIDAVRDEALEPDEAQWAARRQAAVRAAVDALPLPLGRALSLAYLDELTHEQVAAALGTPLGTAKTRIRMALKRLGPALAAAIAIVGAIFVWSRAERAERALAIVTSSDVVPLRLAAEDASAEAHGQFRTRPGASIAVLTTTKLPPLVKGERYVAWARRGEGWTRLGFIERGHEERALLVAEDEALGGSLDELRVTRATDVSSRPTGPTVIAWRRP